MTVEHLDDIIVKGVDGLETVLDFDPNNEHFQVLVDVSSLAKKRSYYNTELHKAMKSSFVKFFVPYIRSLGFKTAIDSSNNHKVTIWEENKEGYTKANVSCETAEILSVDEDRKFGYQPQFDFKITPDTVIVEGYLRRTGGWGLEILDDFLTHFNLCGSGIDKPQIGFRKGSDGYHGIYIASVEHMPKVLAKLQELYGLVAGQKLQDLLDIQRGISELEGGCLHSKNLMAANLLRQEYQKRKELILPANRDF